MAATQNVTIPDYPARKGYTVNVGTILDGGGNCLFKDTSGNEIECSYVNLSADATVPCRLRNQADSTVQNHYLVKGGWHQVSAAKFFTVNYTGSAGLLARFN